MIRPIFFQIPRPLGGIEVRALGRRRVSSLGMSDGSQRIVSGVPWESPSRIRFAKAGVNIDGRPRFTAPVFALPLFFPARFDAMRPF